MASELMDALQALAREKNIDEYEMLERLEAALAQHVPAHPRPRERRAG